MFKFILVVRGGILEKMKEKIEDVISDLGEQDNFFVSDIKTHSIEMIMDHDQIGPLVSRIQGAFNLSLIKNNYLGSNRDTFVMVMGKLQDGGVMKAMQGQAQGLFK
jgi:hypothetical protein